MKTNSSAIELLKKEFTHDGKVCCSAIDTCAGTQRQWSELEQRQLVKPNGVRGSSRGFMGHPYCYALTNEGRKLLSATAN